MGLFNLNYKDLYNNLVDNAPLAIFAILMNTKMRSYFISSDYSSENTNLIYNKIKEFVTNKTVLKEKLGEELKMFKGNTEAYWKDIEPKEKNAYDYKYARWKLCKKCWNIWRGIIKC